MKIDRIEALLWARIDGTIKPEELAELEAHLAEHPDQREIERHISTIAEELDNLGQVQPPPELRERIDGALAIATSPAARPTASSRTHSAPPWPTRWLPLAASLVIGVAVGYLLHPDTGRSIDRSGVTGSMLTPTTQAVAAPVEIQLEDGAGHVVASRAGADVVVDVTLTTEIDLGVTLASADGPVRFTGLDSTNATATEITTEQGWVVIRTRGPGTVTLSASVSDAEEPLRLQVSADGVTAGERWIGPSRIELEP